MNDITLYESFFSKTKMNPSTGCIEWIASVNRDGYGRFRGNNANRISWFLSKGKDILVTFEMLPSKLEVLHSCDNPACVNPEHLSLGTHRENMREMVVRGRGKNSGLLGEGVGTSKLNEDEVIKIRSLYSTGKFSQRSLAKKFKMSHMQINYIVNRKQWTHI